MCGSYRIRLMQRNFAAMGAKLCYSASGIGDIEAGLSPEKQKVSSSALLTLGIFRP